LTAAAAQVELMVVELSAKTAEYAWDPVLGATRFQRATLFTEGDSRAASQVELSARVERTLSEAKPDVVVLPGWSDPGAVAALAWCIRGGIPAVAMSESTAWDEPRKAWKEWIKRQVVGCFSAALVGGRPHADYMAALGLERDRIFLGYDAVDNGYFQANAENLKSETLRQEGRKKHGLPENYFLASARFIEKKNLPRLIEAYALYRKKAEKLKAGNLKAETGGEGLKATDKNQLQVSGLPISGFGVAPWQLVLLGDGPLRSDLKSQVSSLRLQDHVHLPGFIQYPDLPTYYGLAGAFIHASTTEQWGLVVNEAMASGLPVLVSNRCGCASDLVQDGVNGFTFDPHDVEAMAQAMFKIHAMEVGRVIPCALPPALDSTLNSQPSTTLAEMGAASRRIISNWGPDRFASGLLAAANKAVEVGPKRASWIQRLLLGALLRR
jgi:glycosyltransferase involved in cell wall biosynthesis